MIRSFIHIAFLLVISSTAWGQIPQVPSKMDFAGMKLIIHESARKEIQKDVDMIRASDKYFRIKLDRALLYFPLIEKAFDEMGVPSDFKYLSVQESGLISDVISVSKAVGFWQFKDFTGREVGLRIDNRIDERKNIVAASKGAATYLKRNNFLYDNWIYAITAYYAGPGGASKYVDKSNFGVTKMDIDKKTHWYVKRFLAHKIAYENELYNTHSEGMKLLAYTKGAGKDIDKIAKEFNIEPDFLQHYNKWIKSGKIPSDKTYSVIIPVYDDKAEKLIAKSNDTKEKSIETKASIPATSGSKPASNNYAKELKEGILSGNSIRVKINGARAVLAGRNDNINTLSAEGAISIDQFMRYNDIENQKLKTGEVYYLEPKKFSSDIGFHIAEPGETMWTISQRYGIKLKSLYRKNRMEFDEKVKEGRLLWMDSKRPRKVAVEYYKVKKDQPLVKREPMRTQGSLPKSPITQNKKEEDGETSSDSNQENSSSFYTSSEHSLAGKKHKIEAGETLWSIAKAYDITVGELREWNHLTKYDQLNINQELFVEKPVEKKNAKNDDRQKITYIVKPGDTMYRIATKYQMEVTELMNLNGKKDTSISIGEELTVYRSN